MKRQLKMIPLIIAVLGFFVMGMALGLFHEVATTNELIIGGTLGSSVLFFMLMLAIDFPLLREEREHTEIKW